MTNGEKYKTAQERAAAFDKMCHGTVNCHGCKIACKGAFDSLRYFSWLDLEAEVEKPLPCPFCGAECKFEFAYIKCTRCNYTSGAQLKREYAIAAHNRVAKKMSDDGLSDAENCLETVKKELTKAVPGDSIGNVKAALKIIKKYNMAKSAGESEGVK